MKSIITFSVLLFLVFVPPLHSAERTSQQYIWTEYFTPKQKDSWVFGYISGLKVGYTGIIRYAKEKCTNWDEGDLKNSFVACDIPEAIRFSQKYADETIARIELDSDGGLDRIIKIMDFIYQDPLSRNVPPTEIISLAVLKMQGRDIAPMLAALAQRYSN